LLYSTFARFKDLTFDEKYPDLAKYGTVEFNFVIPCIALFHSQCAITGCLQVLCPRRMALFKEGVT
jgi:hypothetical protein